jgi:hypothetical protein
VHTCLTQVKDEHQGSATPLPASRECKFERTSSMMAYQPLIRFRYAIQKAVASGVKAAAPAASKSSPVAAEARAAAPKTSGPMRRIPGPPGVTRTSVRISSAPPRRPIDEEEMAAIAVRL